MLSARSKRSLGEALASLARIAVSTPDNADIAEATARVHEARGEAAKTIDHLAIVLKNSRSLEQRRWAALRIQEYRNSLKAPSPAG
jgi:hypothetical protein